MLLDCFSSPLQTKGVTLIGGSSGIMIDPIEKMNKASSCKHRLYFTLSKEINLPVIDLLALTVKAQSLLTR